nr:MAG TPA: hypothetical protein [Caudoviricetes sp.]
MGGLAVPCYNRDIGYWIQTTCKATKRRKC